DNPVSMGQLGSLFAPQFPDALIVSMGGVEPCGTICLQWFSLQGVTEVNLQQRIDAILTSFIEFVSYLLEKSGFSPLDSALIGFS
ncbi:esterase, partial [Klebsiella pneumoniae]|nr:esterase [Klebsiella pneumoniae]